MATTFPSSLYRYAGIRYNFTAKLFVEENPKDTLFQIDPSKVHEFSYVNRLGDLCITGEMQYTDTTGKVINFMNQLYTMLEVEHVPLDEKFDGPIAVLTPRTSEAFAHVFLVTDMAIIDRNETEITYKMQFVSANWFYCIRTIDYTNYGEKPMQVFQIIRTCMRIAGLRLDDDSFDAAQSVVKLNYITNGNDNLFTISKYLLNKTCYYDDKDGSMRFICYDDIAERYSIYDMSNPRGDKPNGNRIAVSMDKSSFELMTAKEQTHLASVVLLPKTSVFKSLFNRDVSVFDYSANAFTASKIDTNTLANLYNSHGASSETYKKIHGIYHDSTDYVYRSSIWNSMTDIYLELLRNMFDNDALVINTTGYSTRQPADTVSIIISKDRSDAKTDGMKAYEDWLARYRELNGVWFIALVRHMISPSLGYYRLNLVLFKNFTEKQ